MEIDKIKWMMGYAEGFEEGGFGGIIRFDKYANCRFKDVENWYIYPLFLQKVIEGIYGIVIYENRIGHWKWRYKNVTISHHIFFPSSEEAKIDVIKYIYEQEK